jgi:hypothetical protein
MSLKLADRLFAVFLLLTGLYVSFVSARYGLYLNGVPGPGLFPFGAGMMMALLAATLIIRNIRTGWRIEGSVPPSILLSIAGLVAASAAFVLISGVAGLTVGCFVAIIAIGWIAEESHERNRSFLIKLVLISAAVTALCHIIFITLVGIPPVEGWF